MADQHVLDRARIEAEGGHALYHLRLDRIVEERIDDDDAFARRQRPRGVNSGADEIEVVEDFVWPRVPRGAAGHDRGSGARTTGAASVEIIRRDTNAEERPRVLEPRRALCGSYEAVGRGWRRRLRLGRQNHG